MEVCSQNLSDPYTILLKVNGNNCNMNCEYCSELPKTFSEKQRKYDFDKISAFLSEAPKNADIILHGGEPTLIGKENINELLLKINELNFSITPSIQTNGFLGDEWISFFKENRDLVRVSVSIDGNMHCNQYRKTGGNNPKEAFDVVDKFLRDLDKNEIEFRCIATINRKSWDKGSEIVEYFSSFRNLKFVRLNPCFDIDETGVKPWAVTPSQYLACLKDAFNTMLKLKTYEKFKLDSIMNIIESLNRETLEFEFKCNKFSSVFPNGLITSCDAMGDVPQNIPVLSNMFEAFTYPDYVFEEISECEKCDNLNLCRGGCPPLKNRYRTFDIKLLREYCHYRVEIRNYIKRFIIGF